MRLFLLIYSKSNQQEDRIQNYSKNLPFEVLGGTFSLFLVLWNLGFWCGFFQSGRGLLLFVGGFLLLLFSSGDGGVPLGFPDFWLDGLFGLDFSPRLAGNTSLGFQGSSVSLSAFDFGHGTFLVLSSVKDSPGDLSWIFLVF